jgi:protein TonB
MDLINRGQVYRFLLKPVSPGRARLAIEASVKRHLEASESPKQQSPADTVAESPKPAAKPASPARVAPAAVAPPAKAPRKVPEEQKPAAATHLPARVEPTFLDTGRFTATMTGLAATIGKSLAAAADADTDGTGGSAFLRPKFLAVVGAVVIGAAGAGWWFTRSGPAPAMPESTTGTADTAEPAPSVMETDIPQTDPVAGASADAGAGAATVETAAPPVHQALLDEARIARDAGEIVTPPDSNAIQLYVAARTMAPNEPVIAEELAQVINQALALAETALLEQRTEDAATALRMVRLAEPGNPRLPFLDAQVAALQLRGHLDRARLAIRERRFEDASTALTAAETVAGADTPEVRLVADELAAARSAQRVDEVLALASQRMGENALIAPSNDNARYYYELALSTDPANTAAKQGLTIVASMLVLQARAAIDAGELDEAASLLEDAAELDPAGSELAATRQALESAQADAEARRLAELQAEAAQPAAAGAAPAPGGTTLAPGAGAAGAAGLGTAFTANRSVEESLGEPLTAGAPGGQRSDPNAFVPISSLKRTNYVVPEYPRAAQRRNITGWVDVSFTVTERGDVVNVGVMNAEPGAVFNEAATDAISQWRFEPSIENGVAVPKRVAVRLSFDLQ